jgi:hypothetical protein
MVCVIMSIFYASAKIKPIILNLVILNVIMLNVVAPIMSLKQRHSMVSKPLNGTSVIRAYAART